MKRRNSVAIDKESFRSSRMRSVLKPFLEFAHLLMFIYSYLENVKMQDKQFGVVLNKIKYFQRKIVLSKEKKKKKEEEEVEKRLFMR